jgi:hypothetical protein
VRHSLISIIAVVFLVSACSKQDAPTEAPGAPTTAAPGTAATPAEMQKLLPAGHPPLDGPKVTAPKTQTPAAMPPHPVSGGKATVNVPASVKAKWKAVELAVTADGKEQKVKVAVGGSIAVGSGLMLEAAVFLPTYQSDFKTITSPSDNLDNPAVLLKLRRDNQVVSEGWAFQKLPEFDTFKSDKVKVKLLSALAN